MPASAHRPLVRWLREPLLHFLVLGATLFSLQHLLSPSSSANPRRIVVSAQLVEALRQDHARQTGSLPTAAEEEALIERYLADEVLFREALALGLDQGDPVVRRRLIQKMAFLTEENLEQAEPTDAVLQAFLAEHAGRYRRPERFSLTHVLLVPDADPATVLASLAAGADPNGIGQPFLHGRTFTDQSAAQLDARFGSGFAESVAALPLGAWSGPVASAYGFHLVHLEARTPAALPPLADVRDDVRRDWLALERAAANTEARAQLRSRYEVVVERPEARSGPTTAALEVAP